MGEKIEVKLGFPGQEVVHEIEVEDGEPPPWGLDSDLKVVGHRIPRQEGGDKVTGKATYPSDVQLPGLLHGALLPAAHPAARVRRIDTSAAEKMPGVHAIEVFEDRTVRFAGQPIAAVAAETKDQAEDALEKIVVDYEVGKFVVTLDDARAQGAPSVTRGSNVRAGRPQRQGNVGRWFDRSDAIVEETYETQVHTHSPLETHGLVAHWEGSDRLTVWASTQSTFLVRDNLARYFSLARSKVTVIAEHMGGGFGSKFGVRPFEIVACQLARRAGRPVRLMADRKTEQWANGNRPSSRQKVKVGATREGKLTAIQVRTSGVVGVSGNARCANPTIYDFQAGDKEEESVQIHAGPACALRAPGHPQGIFALEQAIDQLAYELEIDPVEFRRRNDSNPIRLAEYDRGAAEIDWADRAPKAGADRGRLRRGTGLASTRWGGRGRSAEALVVIHTDGGVEVFNGAQDIGTGIRTGMAVIVAEELGLPVSAIESHIGRTDWPDGPPSGGSNTGPSIFPAVRRAAYKARIELLVEVARRLDRRPEDLTLAGGQVAISGASPISWKEACALLPGERISIAARRRPDGKGFASGIAGCQFAEVEVDTATGKIRVLKIVAVQDCGQIINRLGVESQIQGGVIQGLGYALYEDRILDRATGWMVNPNLESYKIPGLADLPEIVAIAFDVSNGYNDAGCLGLGEAPVIPTAAALANAVYHATGHRVRKLPMTPDVVLSALG